MKKIIAVVLSLTLLLVPLSISAATVFKTGSADAETRPIGASAGTGTFSVNVFKAGSVVTEAQPLTLTLSLSNAPEATSGSVEIRCGDTLLTSSGEFLISGELDKYDPATNMGAIKFSKAGQPNGSFFSVVLSPNCIGEVSQTVEVVVTLRNSDSIVGTASKSVNLTVKGSAVLYGDANNDGTVDIKDVVLIRQYIVNFDVATGSSSVAVFPGADANGDKTVDIKDVVLIRQYIVNYDVATGKSSVILGPQ